ncbi:MAG: hypothetical protein JO340_13975 [Acidobacteriaceae bacterium]|nr:hypothetical protein [Acidobacteriaceae bacterium]
MIQGLLQPGHLLIVAYVVVPAALVIAAWRMRDPLWKWLALVIIALLAICLAVLHSALDATPCDPRFGCSTSPAWLEAPKVFLQTVLGMVMALFVFALYFGVPALLLFAAWRWAKAMLAEQRAIRRHLEALRQQTDERRANFEERERH